MKLVSIIITISFLIITEGCTNSLTEYNGFIKNSTDSTITFEIIGDTLIFDSLSIGPGLTEKIYHLKEDGDFEIYDCRSFFDTIYYNKGEGEFYILSDSAVINNTSNLESNEIRVHKCTVDVK